MLGAGDAPAVRLEPVGRRAVDDGRQRPLVDAEVVPVDHEHEVVEAQAPRRVARLVGAAGRQAALALEDEDLDLVGAGVLERERLAGGGRHAVARRPRVELQEERLALHLGVAGQTAASAELEQLLPGQGPAAVVGEREALVPVALVADPERLVEHGQRRVDERHGVAGTEHEPIAERQPRPAHVPAHRAREHQRQEHVDLRARAARMAALAVVERQVDALVDQVLDDLVALEIRLGRAIQGVDARGLSLQNHGVGDATRGSIPDKCRTGLRSARQDARKRREMHSAREGAAANGEIFKLAVSVGDML